MTDAFVGLSKLLSGKWKLALLYQLSDGPLRWNQLIHSFPDTAPNVLTRQLRQLEEAGLIARCVIDHKPPQVIAYGLTESGQKLVPFLESLGRWEMQFRQEQTG
jgi:DNA-binding HxlR family transcriptional regulator